MKTTLGTLAAAILLLCIASTASASIVTETFNSLVEVNNVSNTAPVTINGAPSGSVTVGAGQFSEAPTAFLPLTISPVLTATFTDVGTNVVEVQVNSLLSANQTASVVKFQALPTSGGLEFSNTNGSFSSSNLTTTSGVVVSGITSSVLDAAGDFTGLALSSFTSSVSSPITFYVEGTGLDAADFGASLSTGGSNPQIAEALIGNTVSTGSFSEYVGATIPEPASLIVWSLLATLGLGLGWWRKSKAAS
jgi:hypothetical protein